jgi:5-methyltetrahydropteroyltriglutamate--homocysteine methyltransferase
MKFSNDRILTSHVGSLPRPLDLFAGLQARDNGQSYDAPALTRRIQRAIDEIVAKQVELGVDVVDDGEHSKSSFSSYTGRRLGGFEPIEAPFGYAAQSRDMTEFAEAYAEQRAMCAARPSRMELPRKPQAYGCTGPVRYVGQAEVQIDIANLKAAIAGKPITEAFITALSPNNISLYYANRFYKTEEEYLIALADAMHEEYIAIVDAGFLLQVDDPRLATHYDRHPEIGVEECRRFIEHGVEIVNYALRGIPEERVRFHTCYSRNVAPRRHDFELKHYVDLMLKVKACGYSFEASNPRHEHEWIVWQDTKLPDGKLLLPGVVSHCIALIEHPELVAQRIERFAGVVGRERVIASNDCGFGTAGDHDEVHPKVAWAKMKSLVEGAEIASKRLWAKG